MMGQSLPERRCRSFPPLLRAGRQSPPLHKGGITLSGSEEPPPPEGEAEPPAAAYWVVGYQSGVRFVKY